MPTLDELVRQIVREELQTAGFGLATPHGMVPPTPSPQVPYPHQVAPQAAPPPVAVPQIPAASPPVAVPPGPPVASPPGPPVAGPPPATAPTPPTAPVAGVPTLDDLRALANDLMRSKPEKATEFQAFMSSKGVASLADMPPAEYPATAAKFKELMGVA